MQRLIAIGIVCSIISFPFTQSHEIESKKQPDGATVAELKRKRIEFLQSRVTYFERLITFGVRSAAEVIESRMDLINAQLEYAESVEKKKALLTELLNHYDQLILQTGSPGVDASLDVLLLKSEKVRVQIDLELLK